MLTFTVHEPPEPKADRVDRAVDLEFIKDGFSWVTAIFPPLGLIARRMWLATIGYFVIITLVAWVLTAIKVDPRAITLLIGMLGIYLGFEVSTLNRWMLKRHGWRTVGVVNGKSIAECERRFFEGWLPGQPVIGGGSGEGPAGRSSQSAVPAGLGLGARLASRRWPWGRA